jgi:hypothetical protein
MQPLAAKRLGYRACPRRLAWDLAAITYGVSETGRASPEPPGRHLPIQSTGP